MNKNLKHILQKIFVNNISWKIIRPFVYISKRLEVSRENYINSDQIEGYYNMAQAVFTEKYIKHGPFKGMRFDNARVDSDSVFAKLLGSYESELHTAFQKILSNIYPLVLNIGCEDGYYAVGIALRMPETKVIGYDANPIARQQVKELAVLNNVDDRVIIKGKCTSADIDALDPGQRIFMMMDCEGDEMEILTAKNAANLTHSDLLIELHLSKHPLIVEHFEEIFGKTHTITIISNVDDHLKVMNYDYPELSDLSYEIRRFILGERNEFMQWMLIESNEKLN